MAGVRDNHWPGGMEVSGGLNCESASSAEGPATELKAPGESCGRRRDASCVASARALSDRYEMKSDEEGTCEVIESSSGAGAK